MSKNTKNVTLVSAARVREAFAAGEFTAPDAALPSLVGKNGDGRVRGRLNPLAIAAFNEQVKGEAYAGEKSEVEAKTVTLTMYSPKTGRPVKPLVKPLSEVRKAAGIEGRKGRISREALHRAAVAFGSGEPKVAKAKA